MDLREEGRIDDGPLRRAVPNQCIPIGSEGDECIDAWLDTL